MPAPESHPRRRALRRALAIAVASGVLVLGGPVAPAAAQLLPTTTTPVTDEPDPEPAPEPEPEPEPDETTTTTEADEAPTTTRGSTATSRATPTTQRSSSDDEGPAPAEEDEDVFPADSLEGDDDTLGGEVPTETTSTSRDLLVSGDGTDGSQSTTTTSTTVVEVAADEGSLDEQAQIWLIVAGLVAVALLIGVWTWRYWVGTKPAPVEAEPDPTTVFRQT